MKKVFVFIVFLFALFFGANKSFAENFYITNYDVNMDVLNNKSVMVSENIQVNFTNPSHGIIRNIPLGGNSSISNVNVSEQFEQYNASGNYNLRIGSPDSLVTGPKTYNISYIHHLKDKSDEFYYNIIGTEWQVPIQHASFSINMPKAFPAQNVGISIGSKGTVGFKGNATYTVNGNNISGKTLVPLAPLQGITIRIALPQNYFSIPVDYIGGIVASLMVLLALICFLIWFFIGKDDHATPIVTFYPPHNFNSAEVEVLYNGEASKKGLISLIFKFANNGYIKIISDKNKDYNFKLVKLKEYDGNNAIEREFMDDLMFENEVTSTDLEKSLTFYKQCDTLVSKIDKIKERIFDLSSISPLYKVILISCIIGLVVLDALVLVNYDYTLLCDAFPLLLLAIGAVPIFISKLKPNNWFFMILAVLFAGFMSVILSPTLLMSSHNLILFLLGLVCLIVSGICMIQLPKRNKFGNQELGQVLGFKKFLETVEAERVKALIDENPNYCFDVLPYLYVFGLSNKWLNKFSLYFSQNPDWYVGENFNDRSFNHFTRDMDSYSNPSVSNGGVSSSSSGGGGGFSGGGCGGGGGSSW